MQSRICSSHHHPDCIFWATNPARQRRARTTHISLNALSFSSETTSSARGMNWRLYEEMLTSPNTPSSSRIRLTKVETRGMSMRVYACFWDSFACLLMWSVRRDCQIWLMVVGVGVLASDDLDVANEGTTEIYYVGRCGSQGTRFEPEHFVYSMVLSTDVRPTRPTVRREDGLTFNRDTSVTRPNGPAIVLSSTSVFAPLTFERALSQSASPPSVSGDTGSSWSAPSSESR